MLQSRAHVLRHALDGTQVGASDGASAGSQKKASHDLVNQLLAMLGVVACGVHVVFA